MINTMADVDNFSDSSDGSSDGAECSGMCSFIDEDICIYLIKYL